MQGQNKVEVDKLTLEGRKKLTMTGVETVESFSEQSLKLVISGNKVSVIGANIKISSFNKETGVLIADGEFNEIKYSYKKLPIIKRIFK